LGQLVDSASGAHLQPAGCPYSAHTPHDHGSASLIDAPIEGKVSGMVKVGCPLATMLIELSEGGGLNSEGHVSFRLVCNHYKHGIGQIAAVSGQFSD